ncbi:DUF4202 domain-containing protein [Aidingimonas halophila]|uniref:DUF4202 domain-containing protein n=1 Tax=Aidingimonas halophila TaxID=574349 RepID=A0A1H3D360_9GAMM|nr:DUF4202 domain-containing protein [Aidingimonas halophila]GHC30694.1 hypothetical protein GCM10008094_23850 [Aidingimonas halophila]SDX60089.1 protein of unknown function [Aidingimonas halophila]
MGSHDSRFNEAIARLDALHQADPRDVIVDGEARPHEQVYAERMSEWLEAVKPEAGDILRLAVRAQHLQRWRIPRDDYPRDRPGYLMWRRDLGRRQAEQAARVMREVGYDDADCERVASLIRKEGIKRDPDAQALEDTACLVFLQYYFVDFAEPHLEDEDKLLRILQKTWKKMSAHGQSLAHSISLPDRHQSLMQKALA